MRIETILQRLDALQREFAAEALGKPQGKDAFDYGRAIGVYTGLEQAKQLIIGIHRDAEERDREL